MSPYRTFSLESIAWPQSPPKSPDRPDSATSEEPAVAGNRLNYFAMLNPAEQRAAIRRHPPPGRLRHAPGHDRQRCPALGRAGCCSSRRWGADQVNGPSNNPPGPLSSLPTCCGCGSHFRPVAEWHTACRTCFKWHAGLRFLRGVRRALRDLYPRETR